MEKEIRKEVDDAIAKAKVKKNNIHVASFFFIREFNSQS